VPYTHRIVCLANSKKMSGRCVAGLEVVGSDLKGWIRPVSARPTEEVSLDERRYENGQDVQLLDIVEIRFREARPHACQVENHLIDDTEHWQRIGTFESRKLAAHATRSGPLWLDVNSSYSGTNDRIPVADADRLDHSLKLVQPDALRILVGRGYKKRQVRAAFQLGESHYNLGVTDTKVESRYLGMKDGEYAYPTRAVMCVSLGEPFDGYRYKLVASIIDLQ